MKKCTLESSLSVILTPSISVLEVAQHLALDSSILEKLSLKQKKLVSYYQQHLEEISKTYAIAFMQRIKQNHKHNVY